VATPRLHLLLATAVLAAAGCAQQPMRADHAPPAAVSTATPASAAASIAEVKRTIPPNILMFAHDEGYRQVVKKGDNYLFCKLEDPMGSIIAVRQCLDEVQLESLRVRVEQQREELTQRAPETHQTAGP
jgi:hypothetical protein